MMYPSQAYGYTLQGANLRSFSTYQEALAHYNKVKPIRGSNPEVRPIGTRRYKQCAIALDPVTNNIRFDLWNHTCMLFTPENKIKLTHWGWIGPSTASFLDRLIPARYGTVYIDKGKMLFVDSKPDREGALSDKYLINSTDPLVLKVDGDKVLSIKGEPICNWHMNVKAWNQIREREMAKFEPFLAYARVLTAMQSHSPAGEDTLMFMRNLLGIPPEVKREDLWEYLPKGSDGRTYTKTDSIWRLLSLFHRLFSTRMSLIHRVSEQPMDYAGYIDLDNLLCPNDAGQLGRNSYALYDQIVSNEPAQWLDAYTIVFESFTRTIRYLLKDSEQTMKEMDDSLQDVIKVRFAKDIFYMADNLDKGVTTLKRNKNFLYVNAQAEYLLWKENKSTAMSKCSV